MWSEDAQRQIRSSGVSESGSASESEEESGSESEREGGATATAALSREDRKKEKKARKEAAIARKKAQAVEVGDLPPSDDDDSEDDGPMPANPNHSKAARDMVGEVTDRVEKMGVGGNRRERESAEAAAAREKYRMLHEQGKTEEAKADLARLKVIREQREAERARKQVCLLRASPLCEPPLCGDSCGTDPPLTCLGGEGREGGGGGGEKGRAGGEVGCHQREERRQEEIDPVGPQGPGIAIAVFCVVGHTADFGNQYQAGEHKSSRTDIAIPRRLHGFL